MATTDTKKPNPEVPKQKDPVDNEPPAQRPPGGAPPNPGTAKQETRLFQSHPDKKEWLTKDQAEKKGHFWNPKV